MRLRDFRTFAAMLMSLLFIVTFVSWNISEQKPPAYCFTVSIPKAYDPNFTDEELSKFLRSGGSAAAVPESERRVLPNDDTFLIVSLEKDGRTTLNQQDYGSLNNQTPLLERLIEIFRHREELGVYDANSQQIAKAVIVNASRTDKYGTVVKVLDIVKSSGANPIVLRIDGLSE